jgi:hypothetical protein
MYRCRGPIPLPVATLNKSYRPCRAFCYRARHPWPSKIVCHARGFAREKGMPACKNTWFPRGTSGLPCVSPSGAMALAGTCDSVRHPLHLEVGAKKGPEGSSAGVPYRGFGESHWDRRCHHPRSILSWNELLVQSSDPDRYRSHWFRDPTSPLGRFPGLVVFPNRATTNPLKEPAVASLRVSLSSRVFPGLT